LLGIRDAATSSQEQRDKAATAVALGLPDAIVQRHQGIADRFGKHATDLLSQMSAQMRERAAAPEWRDRDAAVGRILAAPASSDDAFRAFRDACADLLYDVGASADHATTTLEVIDEAVAASRGGLAALARHVESQTQLAIQSLAPTPGASPRAATRRVSVGALACIITAVGAAAVPSIIACLATGPLAPACIAVVVGIAAVIVVLGCLKL